MASFNRVILMGNVTRDVEVKYLQTGTAVTEIGMAVNDRRKDKSGQWVDETTFVDVTLWGRTAEIAGEYLTKGAPVLIEGRLKLDQWEKDGKKNSKLRVVGEEMRLLGSRQGGGGGTGGGGNRGRGPSQSAEPQFDDGPSYEDESPPPQRSAGPSRSAAPSRPSPPDDGDDIPF